MSSPDHHALRLQLARRPSRSWIHRPSVVGSVVMFGLRLQALAHVQINRDGDLLALVRLGLVRDRAQERDRIDLLRVDRAGLARLRARGVALRGLSIRVVARAGHAAGAARDADVDRARGLDRAVELDAHRLDRDLARVRRLQHEHVDGLRLNHRAAAEAEAELHRSLHLLAQHLEAVELRQIDARADPSPVIAP